MNNFEFFKEITNNTVGFISAELTDEYILDTWPMSNSTIWGKEEKLLEVRVFNYKQEIKLFRSDVGKKQFGIRVIDDDHIPEDWESFEQDQILDIDTKSTPKGNSIVKTTGGGKYYLPISNTENSKITIKYYIKSDEESGMATVVDWRLMGIKEV